MTSTTRVQRPAVAERVLVRSVVKGMATAIPLIVACLMALVAIAIGGQHPRWGAWLGMAASVGVLAGVFFGAWAGFVVSAHALDDADVPAGYIGGHGHPPARRSRHP
jgi:hypothetical protein